MALQFELDIEPRLKPSLIGGGVGGEGVGGGGGGVNDSQDVSFSQTTKGMQPLKDSVSELEMMTRAGKPYSSSLAPLPPFSSFSCSSLLIFLPFLFILSPPLLPPSPSTPSLPHFKQWTVFI